MKNEVCFSADNFIAEIGVNHENSIEKAKLMIDECAKLKIGTVKFQSYKANKIAANYSPAYWDTKKETTKSQIELFSKFDTFSFDDFKELSLYCKNLGIEFLSIS